MAEHGAVDEHLLGGSSSYKARRTLTFLPTESSQGVEQSITFLKKDRGVPAAASSREGKEEGGPHTRDEKESYASSPQFKRPWRASRPVALPGKARLKKTAVSLSSRFNDSILGAEPGLGETNSKSSKSSIREVDVSAAEAEVSSDRANAPPRSSWSEEEQLPSSSLQGNEGDEEEGLSDDGRGGTRSDSSLAVLAEDLAIDKPEAPFPRQDLEHDLQSFLSKPSPCLSLPQHQPPISRSMSSNSSFQQEEHSSYQQLHQSPLQTHSPEGKHSGDCQAAWREDPVFQGMEYVGCTHQYTQRHYQKFLERMARKASTDGEGCL